MRRLPALLLLLSASCNGNDSGGKSFPDEVAGQALADYKQVVHLNYEEVLSEAKKLESAIASFVADPSEAGHTAAKAAWIAARRPYGPSEAFRFYDGPIDHPESGPEGRLNGWPLDESYIDYTRENPSAGIVNDPARYPVISAEVIEAANRAEGERAIATGYHALEFLLWGQDDVTPGSGAGKRPFTDFVMGGTAQNQERRRAYLTVAAQLLVRDLERVAAAWRPGSDNFGARFGVSDQTPGEDPREQAVAKLLRSLGSLARAELSGERMSVAYLNRTQEDEHSRFSDNTAADLLGNGVGLQNVWSGRYGSFNGVGIDDVVASVAPRLAQQTTNDLATALAKLAELAALQEQGKPIDVVIAAADGSAERVTMLQAIQALKRVAEDIERAAAALGLSVQFEQPSQSI